MNPKYLLVANNNQLVETSNGYDHIVTNATNWASNNPGKEYSIYERHRTFKAHVVVQSDLPERDNG